MTILEWTEPAIIDLKNIREYIASDSAEYAAAVIDRLITSVERLKSFPESGRLVPEAPNTRVGEILVSGYRIIYRLRKGRAQILSMVHSARDAAGMRPEPWDAA